MSAEKQLTALDVANDIWNAAKSGTEWAGGMLAGEFNAKQSTGQIVTDAVISMFPIAGEVTAARDAVAITIRLSDSKEGSNDLYDWIALILCLLAVVPVLGGILKGVGKLILRAASKSEDLVKLGKEILAFLRKMGYGDPAKWLRELDFAKYQGEVMQGFEALLARLIGLSAFIPKRLGPILPASVQLFFKGLPEKLERLRRLGVSKIPKAIRELNRLLDRVRQQLLDGSFADVVIPTAGEAKAMVNEGRLGSKAARQIESKGHLKAPERQYVHVDGWPNLKKVKYEKGIGTFSKMASIEAITMKAGQGPIFRILSSDPKLAVLLQRDPCKAGAFWLESLPENGTAWRLDFGVMHDWSKNTIYEELNRLPTAEELRELGISVPPDWTGLRVWRGRIAEQVDKKGANATGLLFPAGEIQLYVDFEHAHNKPIAEYIERYVAVRKTYWKDSTIPKDTQSAVDYLPQRERSAKIRHEGYLARGVATTGKQFNNKVST